MCQEGSEWVSDVRFVLLSVTGAGGTAGRLLWAPCVRGELRSFPMGVYGGLQYRCVAAGGAVL